MARVSTYLNFPRNTEEAFNFTSPFLAVNSAVMALPASKTFRRQTKCRHWQKKIKIL